MGEMLYFPKLILTIDGPIVMQRGFLVPRFMTPNGGVVGSPYLLKVDYVGLKGE